MSGREHLLLQLAPIVLLFIAGVLLRRLNWATPRHGDLLLEIALWIGIPALLLASVSRLELRPEHIWLPAIAVITIVLALPLAAFAGQRLGLARTGRGALLVCTMALNVGMEYQFVLIGAGTAALAELALFDLGNSVMQATLVYLVAASMGGRAHNPLAALGRLARFPPFGALAIALSLNLSGHRLPVAVTDTLQGIGRWVVLLVILALGILFNSAHLKSRPVLVTVALRMGIGLAVGASAVALLELDRLTRTVVLLGTAAPIGFTAVVVANRESLDTELAASAASLSVLLGLLYVPAVLYLTA